VAAFELTSRRESHYRGLRMSAVEYLSLEDDGNRYELIDGVVCMSPSPSFWHQKIITEIASQIRVFLDQNPLGDVAVEVDVRLRENLVYRPDVVFLSAAKAGRCRDALTETPDLIVEVVSPDSRPFDTKTKRRDYEQAGVGEYWLIDPERESFTFLVLDDRTFAEKAQTDSAFESTVLPGLVLDLERIRQMFP